MLDKLLSAVRPIHIVIATVAISILAVLIIVLVNLQQDRADSVTTGSEPVRNEWANVDSLLPADDFSAGVEPDWIPFRPRETRWGDDRVREHWIDPAAVGRDVLDQEVERRIDGIFQEVP